MIVTNGKLWRLYSSTASNKATHYYEIDLEEVEAQGARLRVSGGLRADLYNNGVRSDGGLSDLLAGDRVEALLLARPPRNFLDPGAFDLCRYLAQQKIDLTGSLRDGELLRLLDRPRPTAHGRVNRHAKKEISTLTGYRADPRRRNADEPPDVGFRASPSAATVSIRSPR